MLKKFLLFVVCLYGGGVFVTLIALVGVMSLVPNNPELIDTVVPFAQAGGVVLGGLVFLYGKRRGIFK
jgi:hypothetical protein